MHHPIVPLVQYSIRHEIYEQLSHALPIDTSTNGIYIMVFKPLEAPSHMVRVIIMPLVHVMPLVFLEVQPGKVHQLSWYVHAYSVGE